MDQYHRAMGVARYTHGRPIDYLLVQYCKFMGDPWATNGRPMGASRPMGTSRSMGNHCKFMKDPRMTRGTEPYN